MTLRKLGVAHRLGHARRSEFRALRAARPVNVKPSTRTRIGRETGSVHTQRVDRPSKKTNPAASIAAFHARGPLSGHLLDVLSGQPTTIDDTLHRLAESAVSDSSEVVRDGDIQLTLFILYALHYGGGLSADAVWEWNPGLISLRLKLEDAFEQKLRRAVVVPSTHDAKLHDVAADLFELTSRDTGPSLSKFAAREATREQLTEMVIQRSLYTLREADPHSWAIPRLTGRPKAALVEIQADEYGGGRPSRVHATIFARTMVALGLDSTYGYYVDAVPAETLASLNMMSMFGLNRRLLGAIVGHLAAFEMTSSIPSRFYGNGFRRLGYGTPVTEYFDEHVEADAVHEQIAARDLAGGLAEQDPAILPDIMFGAAACLYMDGLVADQMLAAWASGKSSLIDVV